MVLPGSMSPRTSARTENERLKIIHLSIINYNTASEATRENTCYISVSTYIVLGGLFIFT